MPALSKEDKLRLLTTMLESRHADLREQNMNRQGKGHFHVSGMGHEALAAVSIQMEPDDYIVPYYRDRGLILGRGMTTRQLGLEYFAKRNTGSGGRQMPSHYSNADLHIWSVPTPTGSQLLPACGIAWGIQLDGKSNLVVTTPQCVFDLRNKVVSSTDALQARSVSGELSLEGEGFECRLADERLVVSNRVHAVIRKDWLNAPSQTNTPSAALSVPCFPQ